MHGAQSVTDRGSTDQRGSAVTDTVSRVTDEVEPDAVPAGRPRRSRPVDKVVFGVAASAVLAFVVWGALAPDAMGEATTNALTWLEKSFGWLFVLTTAAFVVFSAYLGLSRYGNIKLGPDDAEPEFSTFSWVSMMFATRDGHRADFLGCC